MDQSFNDLLAANREFAREFSLGGFDGVAHAGVAIVTCMDSRIAPLQMVGLQPGDAKILRNPGGRVTESVVQGLILAVNLLGVDRILIIAHTHCAMVINSERELQTMVTKASDRDASGQGFRVVTDQLAALTDDIAKLRSHPLVPASLPVGGFLYDVETGLLDRLL